MKLLKIPPGGSIIEKPEVIPLEVVFCYSDGSVKRSKAISAFIAQDHENKIFKSHWKLLSDLTADSNVPELEGLVMAIDFCVKAKIKNVVFYCDSFQALSFIKQELESITKYPQTQKIVELLAFFDYYRIQSIDRKNNKADALCQKAIKALNIK